MQVWKLITDIDPDIADSIRDKVTYKEDALLTSLQESGQVYNWDLIEDEKITPFLICEEKVLNILNGIFSKYGSEFEYINITEEFLMGEYEIPDEDFISYREQNLTEDIIYSKIIYHGVDSLTELDKRILDESTGK
jgi:hypothetical protein